MRMRKLKRRFGRATEGSSDGQTGDLPAEDRAAKPRKRKHVPKHGRVETDQADKVSSCRYPKALIRAGLRRRCGFH